MLQKRKLRHRQKVTEMRHNKALSSRAGLGEAFRKHLSSATLLARAPSYSCRTGLCWYLLTTPQGARRESLAPKFTKSMSITLPCALSPD